jgi:hypothetical protein
MRNRWLLIFCSFLPIEQLRGGFSKGRGWFDTSRGGGHPRVGVKGFPQEQALLYCMDSLGSQPLRLLRIWLASS